MTILQISHIGLWILALLLVPVSIALLHLLSVIEQRSKMIEETAAPGLSLKLGTLFPSFVARDLMSGDEHESVDLYQNHQRVVVVLQPGCAACGAVVSELRSWSISERIRWGVVLICFGSDDVCVDKYGSIESMPILKGDPVSMKSFVQAGLPLVIVVGSDGIVRASHVGKISIRNLVEKWGHQQDAGQSLEVAVPLESDARV